jgi:hypothetical protein
MSKKVKILISVGAGVLALAILTLVLALVGFRFSSKHTLENMWRDEAVISAEDYDFYYTTADLYGDEAQHIKAFRAVKKSGFLRRAVKTEDMTVRALVEGNTGAVAGTLTTLKGDDCYYHFFTLAYNLPAALEPMHETNVFTVNGTETEVLHHSYFVTEGDVSSLSICGIALNFAK